MKSETGDEICLILYGVSRAVSSVGSEHHVDNVRVAGSSPAQPTRIIKRGRINRREDWNTQMIAVPRNKSWLVT